MAAFGFFEPQKGQSAEGIAKSRAMAAALLRSGGAPRNVGEGLNAIGDAIFYRSLIGNADASEKAGTEAFNSTFNSLIAPYSGGQASTVPMPTAAGEVAATAPAVDISGSRKSFIESLLPAAIEQGKRTGVDPRIIVAQAAQETGWGKSAPGNNYFGIKSHGQSGGNTLATTEYVNGSPVTEMASFRGYASPADSVRGYGDFITQNPRYKPLREAQGLDAQLAALGASGYATDPNYANSVGSIARSIALPNQQIASASPVTATDAIESVSPQVAAPQLPAPTTVAAAPAVAEAAPLAAPQQIAQNFQPQQIDPRLIEAANSPFATPGQKAILGGIIQQQQARNELILKQQMQQADPSYQMGLEKNRLEIEKLRRGDKRPTQVVDKRLLQQQDDGTWADVTPIPANGVATAEPAFAGNSAEVQAANYNVENGIWTKEQAANYLGGKTIVDPATGAQSFFPANVLVSGQQQNAAPQQQQPYVDLFGSSPPQQDGYIDLFGQSPAPSTSQPPTTSASPQTSQQPTGIAPGAITLTGGRPEKLTEAQERNKSLWFNTKADYPTAIENFDALSNPKNQAFANLPLSDYFTTPQYQQAFNAVKNIIGNSIYSTSGASAPIEEVENQARILMPRPGESDESLADKKRRIRDKVNSIGRAGAIPDDGLFQEESADIMAARAAIAKGAPRDKVIERLKAANIDTTGL